MRHGLRRAVAVAATALLWAGLSPGAAGGAHAAGRAAEPGPAMAWGNDNNGQLGDGATVESTTTPVAVCGGAPCPVPLDDVIAVESGNFHSVVLRADGTVWAWGSNGAGQLGDGTGEQRNTPVRVGTLTGVTAISAGSGHTLALRSDGTVWALGFNTSGQAGDGTTDNKHTPVQVCAEGTAAGCTRFLTGVTAIAAGGQHSLALRSNGSVVAWGYNASGQLGIGNTESPRTTPVATLLTSGVRAVGAGTAHSLAVLSDTTVNSWGWNASGQLGDGTTTDSSAPVPVCDVGTAAGCTAFLSGVTAVEGGEQHSLARRSDGGVRSWGDNAFGQLGDGSNSDRLTPVRVCATGVPACTSFLGGVTAVAAGTNHSLTRQADGTARSWGWNRFGTLGNGTTEDSPIPTRVCAPGQTAPCARLLDGVGAVAAGAWHSLAITQPRADVRIAIATTDEPVATGEDLTYRITVRNDGPTAAENVTIDETVPPGTRFVSATSSRGSCTVPPAGSSDTVTCSLGTLGANSQATADVVVTVRAPVGTEITNTATVTSTTPDPKQNNNTATIQTWVS